MTAPAILRRRRPQNAIARFDDGATVKSVAPGLLWHPGCHCPGCGQRQWNVGRVTAECAVCETPLIIAHDSPTEGETTWLAA
jgi:hypothetical protein